MDQVSAEYSSMSLICLMLFFTIVSLSAGIGFKTTIEAGLKKATAFDASIILTNKDKGYNIEDILNQINFKISKNEKSVAYNEYVTGIKASDFLTTGDMDFKNVNVVFVKISDYNEILKFKNQKELNLNKDEILILSVSNKLINPINEKIKNNNKININGKEYLIKNPKAIEENLQTQNMANNRITIIINDEFLSGYKISTSVLNVNYLDKNREEYNKKYAKISELFLKGEYKSLNIDYIVGMTKDAVYSKSKGFTTILLFIVIYLGIVFLITSMAILALQQLSEASDSIERYKALRRLGANKRMIDKTIFVQTLIYFSLPVILAVIHSVVGIKVTSDFMNNLAKIDIRSSALVTALVFTVIYAGYFYTTYVGYKNIVKSNL